MGVYRESNSEGHEMTILWIWLLEGGTSIVFTKSIKNRLKLIIFIYKISSKVKIDFSLLVLLILKYFGVVLLKP